MAAATTLGVAVLLTVSSLADATRPRIKLARFKASVQLAQDQEWRVERDSEPCPGLQEHTSGSGTEKIQLSTERRVKLTFQKFEDEVSIFVEGESGPSSDIVLQGKLNRQGSLSTTTTGSFENCPGDGDGNGEQPPPPDCGERAVNRYTVALSYDDGRDGKLGVEAGGGEVDPDSSTYQNCPILGTYTYPVFLLAKSRLREREIFSREFEKIIVRGKGNDLTILSGGEELVFVEWKVTLRRLRGRLPSPPK